MFYHITIIERGQLVSINIVKKHFLLLLQKGQWRIYHLKLMVLNWHWVPVRLGVCYHSVSKCCHSILISFLFY